MNSIFLMRRESRMGVRGGFLLRFVSLRVLEFGVWDLGGLRIWIWMSATNGTWVFSGREAGFI